MGYKARSLLRGMERGKRCPLHKVIGKCLKRNLSVTQIGKSEPGGEGREKGNRAGRLEELKKSASSWGVVNHEKVITGEDTPEQMPGGAKSERNTRSKRKAKRPRHPHHESNCSQNRIKFIINWQGN